ncbi:hypothetical protein ACJX0J_031624 [Zea mays]
MRYNIGLDLRRVRHTTFIWITSSFKVCTTKKFKFTCNFNVFLFWSLFHPSFFTNTTHLFVTIEYIYGPLVTAGSLYNRRSVELLLYLSSSVGLRTFVLAGGVEARHKSVLLWYVIVRAWGGGGGGGGGACSDVYYGPQNLNANIIGIGTQHMNSIILLRILYIHCHIHEGVHFLEKH